MPLASHGRSAMSTGFRILNGWVHTQLDAFGTLEKAFVDKELFVGANVHRVVSLYFLGCRCNGCDGFVNCCIVMGGGEEPSPAFERADAVRK